MEQIQLEVETRSETGSAATKSLRLKGYIPGVVYGGTDKPVAVKVSRKIFDRIKRQHQGESLLYNIEILDQGKKSKSFTAVMKEQQYHPVNDTVEHLDFLRISMDKEISIRVPVLIKGEAIGLKKPGATLEIAIRELEVICLPKNIPHYIEVDVTNLDSHHAIHVSELVLPQGVRTKIDPSAMVVAVVFATREEVPAAGTPEAGKAEPEVIKEKPKEEKAAEGAAKPAAGGKAEGGAKK